MVLSVMQTSMNVILNYWTVLDKSNFELLYNLATPKAQHWKHF